MNIMLQSSPFVKLRKTSLRRGSPSAECEEEMIDENFVLSKELLEQIFFGMENQGIEFFLDMQSLKIIDGNEAANKDKEQLNAIPNWQPVDGYNLMESFVTSLNNPLAKEELHKTLQTGRGVFREFKKTLKKHREIERLWFAFREKHMRKRVLEWFNAIRESQGLNALSVEIADTEDLVLSDFIIRMVDDLRELEVLAQQDKRVFEELFLRPGRCTILVLLLS